MSTTYVLHVRKKNGEIAQSRFTFARNALAAARYYISNGLIVLSVSTVVESSPLTSHMGIRYFDQIHSA